MVKVITYGTFDLLHYGHIRLLERAKALGDYLIVGVTTEDFDRRRGKINVQQSLQERIEGVRSTGLADKIILEEYEGQKIDDIKRYGVDIFTVGSDWKGKFDYLQKYCKVVYLDRTHGISSTDIRKEREHICLGLVGYSGFLNKVEKETKLVNGLEVTGICTGDASELSDEILQLPVVTNQYQNLLDQVDAVYIHACPDQHYNLAKQALERGKHVLLESPMGMRRDELEDLRNTASIKKCVLEEACRTAYSTAYSRMVLLAKSGKIGKVVSVDAVCTSMKDISKQNPSRPYWSSMTDWGPTAMLPIFQILGTDYRDVCFSAHFSGNRPDFDTFVKADFKFGNAVASLHVGNGVKAEGSLVVSGTTGYIYVPAPWWKTDYFEIRRENPNDNERYFYQLDGEGICYEMVAFASKIRNPYAASKIEPEVSQAIVGVIEDFYNGKRLDRI